MFAMNLTVSDKVVEELKYTVFCLKNGFEVFILFPNPYSVVSNSVPVVLEVCSICLTN